MRRVISIAVLFMIVLFSGCEYFDNTPGSFHIKFEWNETDKPDFATKDYYAWVLLEEWPDGDKEKAVLLMQTAASKFDKTGKVSIDLTDLKYGDNRVVKVEIRGSEKTQDRVLYFGRSELFSFSSKDRNKEVAVAMQTVATPGTGDDVNRFHLLIVQNGNVVNKINNTEVTVRINVVNGSRVIVANSLSILEKYLNDKKSVTEGFADKALSDLKVYEGSYHDLEKWELNFGLDLAEDAGGERIVYGKLINDDGYLSETVQVSVLVDKTPPGIINPAVTPNPAKLGDIVTAVFSFTEPVDIEKLDLDWDGLGFVKSESVTENVFSYTFELTAETEERTFALKGAAYDEIGNGPVDFVIGDLKVDRTLPVISDENVTVTEDKSAVREGDTVTVIFKVSEDLEKDPEVTVDGKKFKRVGDSADPYTFSYTVSSTDIEGIKTVLVSLSDLARNQNVVEMEQPVKFDLSAPEVINPTVTPAGDPGNAGIGTKIEVRFNISEPVKELKFLVNDSESSLFKETVTGLTYSYTRTVESGETALQYDFSVSAVDGAGNELEPYTLGAVAVDVGMPSVEEHDLSKTNVRLLEVFTLDLEFSEELKAVTVLVGSKDISGGCVKSSADSKKYTCTHTANVDSDEGDGVKQFSVQMTDMSGNSSTVQLKKTGGSPLTIEYDVTSPAVVNPVIAPSKANLDSTIDVRFSFTEDVENVVIDWNGLEFMRFNELTDKKLFIYKHSVKDADEEKSYLIKILEASDMAGNPISSEIEIGTVEIDNTAPQIYNPAISVGGDDSRRYVLENETVIISFEVKEDLSDYAVRIGLKKLENCTDENITNGKKYTCTYSTPSAADGEGIKDVTVEVKDLAGNGTSYPVGQLTYDMSGPQLSSAIVIPEKVNSSADEVKVQFSFSEDVQIEVDEVYIVPENFGPELTLNCNTGSGYAKQFICTYTFLETDTRVENYDISVDLRDKAGNIVTGMYIGKIQTDREDPYISSQNVSPSAVKGNELFTVTFTVNEELAAKPVVKVGDKQLSESSCTGSINYTCQHNANEDSDETDGVKSVTVSLRDPSGNTSIITLSQTVTYDATRPELLNPVIIPEGTANRYNSTIQVRFSFSEKINYPDSFDFTLIPAKGGSVPSFNCTPANANNQSFTCETVFEPSDETDDTLTFTVNAADLAGNTLNSAGIPVEVGVLKVDRLEPGVTFNALSPLNVMKSTGSVTVQFTVDEEIASPPVVNIGSDLTANVPSNVSGLQYTYVFNDLTLLGDGSKQVAVFISDLAGNMKTAAHTENISVDRSAPSIIAKTVAPSIANLNTEKVAVNFTFSEKIDGFVKEDVTVSPAGILTDYACVNSSGDEQNYSCEFSMDTSGEYEGSFTFSVSAEDKNGNPMAVNPAVIGTLTVARKAPELTFDSITPLLVNNSVTSASVQFTVDKVPDGNPVVRIGTEKTLSTPFEITNGGKTFKYIFNDLSGISDGNKNIIVELKDDAGNNVTGTSTEQILFDRLAPSVVSKNIAPAVVNKDTNQIVISFTFSEKMTALTNADVTVSPAGLPAHNCTSSDAQSYSCTVDISALGTDKDGTYTYSVSGSDQYGNPMSSAEVLGSVTVDRSDLGITFNGVSPSVVIKSTASVNVTFTLSETPLENPVVKLAGTKIKTAPSSVTGLQYTYNFNDLAGITDGEKGVTISVKDSSGNSITEDFTGPLFDRTAPSVVSKNVSPAVANKNTNQIVISFTFSEKMTALTNANVTVSPSGKLPAHNCTSSDAQSYSCTVDISSLGNDKDGTYTYSVSGSDQYGNPMTSSEVLGSVTVDRSDLGITFNNVSPSVVISSTASVDVTFTLSETPLENPVVKLAGTKTKTAPSSVTGLQYTYTFNDLSGITDGEKGVTITVKDPSGNSITQDFSGPLFDRTEPTLVSSNTTPLIVNRLTNEIVISFTYSEKMSAWSNANLTISPSGKFPAPVCSTSDSQSYQCSISTSALGSSADGPYTFKLAGTDQYGNPMSSPADLTGVTVDRTDPSVVFNNVTPATVKASTASLTVIFTASETLGKDPVVTIGSELSGNTPSSVSGLHYTYVFNDFSMLSDGYKTLKVQVTDLRGNVEEYEYGTQINVDKTHPSVLSSTVSPSIANEGTSSVTLNFTFSEKIQGFVKSDVTTVPSGHLTNYNCVNSSGDEQTYSCTYDTSSLGEYEGAFTFHVEAEDKSGNPMIVNPAQIGTLTVDRNAPELTFDLVTPSTVNIVTASVTVRFTVDDVPAGNPVVKIGTEKTKSAPSSVTNGGKTFTYIFSDLTGISDGNKAVTVELQDSSGNPVSAVWSGTLKFDRTAPQMISSTVAPSFVNKTVNTLNISFSYSEPMTAFVSGNLTVSPSGILPAHSCSAIDGNNQTITCTIDTSSLNSSADDFYTFTVTGTDAAGNPMESASTAGFTEVDRTAPGITLNSITPETVNSSVTSVTVVFTVSETLANNPVVKIGSEKTLTVPDSVSGLQYTYKFNNLTGITDGPKTLNIQVKDIANNIESNDFTNLFFDRTAPIVVSKNVAPVIANGDTDQIVISFTFSEKMTALTNANVTVSPSGLPAHNCTSSDTQSYSCTVDISALGTDKDDTYTYSVSGSDQYGNPMSSAEILGSVTVERTDPVITFTSALPATVNSTTPSVTVKFSVSETPQSNPVVKLGTTKQLDTPSNISGLAYTYIFSDLSGINDGEKTINISLYDTKGNLASGDYEGPVFDRTLPTVMNSFASPVVVNGSNDLFYINITFSEKMQAMVNTDITVSPSGILPTPVCGNPNGDLQNFRCGYNIAGMEVDETYTFSVTADDYAWNRISPDPVEVATLKIDRTDPSSLLTSLVVYDQGTSTIKSPALPARAGDIVLVAIQLSEDLSSNPIALLGTRPMTLQGASCLSGTCYFARTIDSSDGDGTKGFSVEMEDEAGNSKINIFPSQIVIDTTPPEMHSNFMTPANAKLGDTIEVKFKFSEPVNTSLFYVSSTITFTKNTGQSTDTNFVYTATVGSSTPAGAINFYVATRDPAGNWTNGGSWLLVGSVTVDKTAPGFSANTCDVTVSSGYTNPAGVKAVKAGQTVTANCNITANETIKGNPVLKVGGYAALRQGSCPGGYNNCYVYTVTGAEGDGNKVITAEIEDLAGNITSSSTGQQVAFDFTGPRLVFELLTRTPAFAPARDTGTKTLLLSHRDPYNGSPVELEIFLYADEDLAQGSVNIYNFSYIDSLSVDGNVVTVSRTMDGTETEGAYSGIRVGWQDKLGNAGEADLSWIIAIDKTQPSLDSVNIEKITYTRVPWGSDSTDIVPNFSLEGLEDAVAEGYNIAKILAYSEGGLLIGEADVQSNGSFDIPYLTGGNQPVIYLTPVEKSGNKLDISNVPGNLIKVRNVSFIATLKSKVPYSMAENQITLNVIKQFNSELYHDPYEPEQEELDGAMSSSDGLRTTFSSGYAWYNVGDRDSYGVRKIGSRHGNDFVYRERVAEIYAYGGTYATGATPPYGNPIGMDKDLYRMNLALTKADALPRYGDAPDQKYFHSMIYDSFSDKLVLFGGGSSSISVTDDFYYYDFTFGLWTKINPSGDKPSARESQAMVFDSWRNRYIVFGGSESGCGSVAPVLNDMWEFNPETQTWEEISQYGSVPSPRRGHSLVFDPSRGRLVLFGGQNESGTMLNDLYEFDILTKKWFQITPVGTPPSARGWMKTAFDSRYNRIYYFSGMNSFDSSPWPTVLNDVWAYDPLENRWTYIYQKSGYSKMVYDKANEQLVFLGKYTGSTPSEVWYLLRYNPNTMFEEEITLSAERIGALTGAAGVYSPNNDSTYIYGGTTDNLNSLHEMWLYEHTSNQWKKIPSAGDPSVEGRTFHCGVYHEGLNSIVFFSGVKTLSYTYLTYISEFSLDTNQWNKRTPVNAEDPSNPGSYINPNNRKFCKAVYDKSTGKVILYGGDNYNNYVFEWTASTGDRNGYWTAYNPSTAPSADSSGGHSLVYDDTKSRSLLYKSSSELWAYNSTTHTWLQLSPSGTVPESRKFQGMVYDSGKRHHIMTAGEISGSLAYDVWGYRYNSTWLDETDFFNQPPGRILPVMTYSPVQKHVLMYGGNTVTSATGVSSNDVYILNTGYDKKPAMMITIPPLAVNMPENTKIERVRLTFISGGTGYSPTCSSIYGSMVYVWYNGRWMSAGTNYSSDTSPSEIKVDITDKDIINALTTTYANSFYIALSTIAPNRCGNDFAKISLDYVEIQFDYYINGPKPLNFDIDDYYFSTSYSSSWQNGRDQCIAMGWDLVSIDSEEEKDFIESHIVSNNWSSYYYWIGLHDNATNLDWRSVNGHSVWKGTSTGFSPTGSYTNWYATSPTSSTTSNCVFFRKNTYDGAWRNYSCTYATSRYICERPKGKFLITSDMSGYTWDNSYQYCRNTGGKLAQLDNELDQIYMERSLDKGKDYWIGYTDSQSEGAWKWSSGYVGWSGDASGYANSFNNWLYGEPSGDGNYAAITAGTDFKWDDAAGDQSNLFVCEFTNTECSRSGIECEDSSECCNSICYENECVGCMPNNGTCSYGSTCCSNICNTGTQKCVLSLLTGEKTCSSTTDCSDVTDSCVSGKCCRQNQETCSVKNDCCYSADSCYNSKCCRPIDESCITDSNCCIGECIGTLRKNCECRQYNVVCSTNKQCCSGICSGSRCAKGGSGAFCYVGTDCASGVCIEKTSTCQ